MRRLVFLILGCLELCVAALLLLFAQLLSEADVAEAFAKAERVTRQAGDQVRLVRQEVRDLRRPEWQELAERLQAQTRIVTSALQTQQVDFETVRTLHDALGDVAGGLERFADTLQAEHIGKLGDGLGETAEFLEKVVPATTRAADDLEKATETLRADAGQLAGLLSEAPLDLKAAHDIHDSLAHFGEGLDKMKTILRLEQLDAVRDGFDGMQTSLATGADQVERLSRFTYPVITFHGLVPEVDQRQFWPEGETIAKGLRKAAGGVKAADKEMANLARDVPHLRASLEDSRKIVDKTREALALALRQHDKLEPLLKEMPTRAARLAEQLPALGTDVAQVLRGTGRLKEVGTALRQAQASLDAVGAHWPELRMALTRSATLLRATRGQLQTVLRNRHQYESAQHEAASLGESFALMVPLFTDQFTGRLQHQDAALDDLEQGLVEVGDVLPVYGQTMSRLLLVGRLLAWLMAGIVALHGAYLLMTVRFGRRYSL
jgi:hypothetical protein